jgi:uroporphyrinogen-III decarboxylase
MDGRDRVRAAFSPEGTPEIPAVICYEDLFVRDHWSELSAEPWWVRMVPDMERQMKWRQQVAEQIGQDWYELPVGPGHREQAEISIEERDGTVYRIDRHSGRAWAIDPPTVGGWPRRALASVHPLNPPQTPEQVAEWMSGQGDPEAMVLDGRADLAERVLAGWGATLFPMAYVAGPLWSCYQMWGFEGMMTLIAERPDLVRHAAAWATERGARTVHAAARLGALGIWVEDCMTDMISPSHFAALNLPFLQQLMDEIRASGMYSIHYFCGDPSGKWELLFDTGADALSLEESKKRFVIDVEDVVERVDGRMAVLGNLDAVYLLEHAAEDTLRAEIARQVAAGRRNRSRFIMSLGSPVTPGTLLARVRLYCDLAHEMGK